MLTSALTAALGLTLAATPAPLALADFVRFAEERNPDLAALEEKRAQAEAELNKAWSALLPVATIGAQYTHHSAEAKLPMPDGTAGYVLHELPTPPSPPGSVVLIPNKVDELELQRRNQFGAAATLSVPLFVPPAYRAIAAAGEGGKLAEEVILHGRDELLFGVAQAYYGAVASRRLVELANEQLKAAEAQERLAKVRFDAGQVTKIAWLRAAVDRTRTEQDVRNALSAYGTAKYALVALTGVDGDFEVAYPETFAQDEGAGVPVAEAEQRHDLRAAKHGVAMAERGLSAQQLRWAPMLAANAEYRWANLEGFTGDKTAWQVQLSAVFTLFDGGRSADIELARSRLREAEAQEKALAWKVEQEVQTARLELESARANHLKAVEQERLAAEGARLVEAHVEAGTATYLEAVDARTVRFAAGVGVLTGELGVRLAALKLARASGRLGESLRGR